MLIYLTRRSRSFADIVLPARRELSRFLPIMTAIILGLSIAIPPAPAQTTFGSITGVVTDQSRAAVPNAQITVVNQDTGFTRRQSTGGHRRLHGYRYSPRRISCAFRRERI